MEPKPPVSLKSNKVKVSVKKKATPKLDKRLFESADYIEKEKKKTTDLDGAVGIVINHLIKENIKHNELTQQFEINGKSLTEQELNGVLIHLLSAYPKVKGMNKHTFEIVLNSNLIPSFNPLVAFIDNNEQCDTEGNIQRLSNALSLANHEKTDSTYTFIKKWFVGMVASIYDDNYNPLMFILIGAKGCGKTEFFRRLLPLELKTYFAQSKLSDGKDSEALMCEALLVLNDELDGLHAREARAFRNFISANYYHYRPPYGKQNIRRKRLASVCGASNDRAVVNDPDNNRRIIPIEILSVDHDIYNSIDKTELFMEAYRLYKSGYDWNLTSDDIKALDKLSDEHEISCVENELVQRYFSGTSGESFEWSATEILEFLYTKTIIKLNINKIAPALKRIGIEQKVKTVNGKTKRVYHVTCYR